MCLNTIISGGSYVLHLCIVASYILVYTDLFDCCVGHLGAVCKQICDDL